MVKRAQVAALALAGLTVAVLVAALAFHQGRTTALALTPPTTDTVTGAAAVDAVASDDSTRETFVSGPWSSAVYTAPELSDERGSATIYGFPDGPPGDPLEALKRVQAVFGVAGTPREEWEGTWTVGADAWVTVEATQGMHFRYHDDSSMSEEDMDAWWGCEDRCEAPAVEDAEAELRRIMTALGMDVDDFDIRADVQEGTSLTSASASPRIVADGAAPGPSLELTPKGINSARGPLNPVVALREVPVVSEAEAFERLSDPRFPPMELIIGDEPIFDDQPEVEEDGRGEHVKPRPGDPIPWRVRTVNLRSVSLEQAPLDWSDDALFVPVYIFRDDHGAGWPVLAVAEEALDVRAH